MSTSGEGAVSQKSSKKPKYSKFTQQELPACKPLLTPAVVISTFFIIGVIFIPIGAVSLLASNGVVEVKQRYDQACLPDATDNDERSTILENQLNATVPSCTLTVTVPKKMVAPIFVYYQLDNFYQNHRRYVKSRSDSQLRGDSVSGTALDVCKPEAYLGGNSSLPIDPCGLIAWSLFNDTYTFAAGGSNITVDETNISWKSDRDVKFGTQLPENFNTVPALQGGGTLDPATPLNQDEHLIVWMRTAALPTFRKLWGRIRTDIAEDTVISISIKNVYNTYSFGGAKYVVLSTASWLGGKNSFLGIAYLAVGGLSILLALLFLLLQIINPRELGDTSLLSWNKKALAAGRSGN